MALQLQITLQHWLKLSLHGNLTLRRVCFPDRKKQTLGEELLVPPALCELQRILSM